MFSPRHLFWPVKGVNFHGYRHSSLLPGAKDSPPNKLIRTCYWTRKNHAKEIYLTGSGLYYWSSSHSLENKFHNVEHNFVYKPTVTEGLCMYCKLPVLVKDRVFISYVKIKL